MSKSHEVFSYVGPLTEKELGIPKRDIDMSIHGVYEREEQIPEIRGALPIVQRERVKTPEELSLISAVHDSIVEYLLAKFDVDSSSTLPADGLIHIFDAPVFQELINLLGKDFEEEENIVVHGFCDRGSVFVREQSTIDELASLVQHEMLHIASHQKIRLERDADDNSIHIPMVRYGVQVDKTGAFHNLDEYVIEKTNLDIQKTIWGVQEGLKDLSMEDKDALYGSVMKFGNDLVGEIARRSGVAEQEVFTWLQRAVFFGDSSVLRTVSSLFTTEEFRRITHIKGSEISE